MSQQEIMQNLDDLIKIPQGNQDNSVVEQLQSYRKVLADEFYANEEKDGKKVWTCKYDRKLEIYPHLSSLHKYFGMKEIHKPFPPNKGGGRKIATKEARIENVANFLAHMQTQFKEAYGHLNSFEKIQVCAIVWGPA